LRHYIYLDIDHGDFEKTLAEAQKLNRKYGLGGFVIVLSSPANPPDRWHPHYHVRFNRPVDLETKRRVIMESSADPKYKEYAGRFKSCVIRLFGSRWKHEPEVIRCIFI